MSSPILTFAPKIDPEAPAWLRQHLTLIYQKLGNHTQAMSLLAKKTPTTENVTNLVETVAGSGGGGAATVGGVNDRSGVTSYATMSGDNGSLLVLDDASPIAVSLATFTPPWFCFVANIGAGTATLTPAGGTISYAGHSGAGSLTVPGGYCAAVFFDGVNWWAFTEPLVPLTFGAVTHEFLTSYNAATGTFTAAQPAFTDISGSVAPAQLPTPTGSTLGGVKSASPVAHEWIAEIDTTGTPLLTQPAFSDLTGVASPAQLPTPTTSSLGGVEAVAAVTHQWVDAIDTSGVPQLSQPAFADISGTLGISQLPASGLSVTITTAQLTPTGTQGSMTFTNGLLTAQTPAT